MKVPSGLFCLGLYHYEVAIKRIEPDWLSRALGNVPRDVYFIRRFSKSGPSDEELKVLHVTHWNSPLTGERIFDWLGPKCSSTLYDVLYFDTLEEAKLIISNAIENSKTLKFYEPSQDSVYSTKDL